MIHTLQNLPTVSEGNKSNDKRRTDKNNLKKKKCSNESEDVTSTSKIKE